MLFVFFKDCTVTESYKCLTYTHSISEVKGSFNVNEHPHFTDGNPEGQTKDLTIVPLDRLLKAVECLNGYKVLTTNMKETVPTVTSLFHVFS